MKKLLLALLFPVLVYAQRYSYPSMSPIRTPIVTNAYDSTTGPVAIHMLIRGDTSKIRGFREIDADNRNYRFIWDVRTQKNYASANTYMGLRAVSAGADTGITLFATSTNGEIFGSGRRVNSTGYPTGALNRFFKFINDSGAFYVNATEVLRYSSAAVNITGTLGVTGATTLTGGLINIGATTFSAASSRILQGIDGGNAHIMWINAGGAADEKVWDWIAGTSTLVGRLVDDVNGSANNWISVARTGFASPAVTLPGTLGVTGATTLSSTLDGSSAITDTAAFTTTATRLAIFISGAVSTDKYVASTRIVAALGSETLPVAGDLLGCAAKTDSLIILRAAGTTSGLKISYMRIK